jgi:hypothetical protein
MDELNTSKGEKTFAFSVFNLPLCISLPNSKLTNWPALSLVGCVLDMGYEKLLLL